MQWIDERDTEADLRDALALLAAWQKKYQRGSAETQAAKRLELRAERRIGQLVPPKPPGPAEFVTDRHEPTPPAERKVKSRARALAAIPQEAFEQELAKPKPSREKMLQKAIVPEPTVDPAADESARVHRLVHGPKTESWPHMFDVPILNEKAVMTVREAVESWRRWCDMWGCSRLTGCLRSLSASGSARLRRPGYGPCVIASRSPAMTPQE